MKEARKQEQKADITKNEQQKKRTRKEEAERERHAGT